MNPEEAQHRAVPPAPFMEILQAPAHHHEIDDGVSEYQPADDMTVRTTATMDDATARRKYGLRNWRKYALYRHGNNPKFLNSTQGREILKANFRNEVKRDLDGLSQWIAAVDAAAAAMEEELNETRMENNELLNKLADTERLLGIQDEMKAVGDSDDEVEALGGKDAHKIQYVVLLEKKLSVATWEAEELRAEVAALKQSKNNDAASSKMKRQLESVTQQRDELLSERGIKSREIEEKERSLATQLEEVSRARVEMSSECNRIESDCAARVEALFGKLEVVQRQRDDLLSEQRLWRRERDELMENMASQVNDLSKQKEQLMSENLQLRTQIVHLTPINVEAGASRFKAAPASLHSNATAKKVDPPLQTRTQADAVPEKKPPSASLKSKLEEWNKQRDRMAEEQQTLKEQEAAGNNAAPPVGKSSVQSVLSAISPSSILGSVKKLADRSTPPPATIPATVPDIQNRITPLPSAVPATVYNTQSIQTGSTSPVAPIAPGRIVPDTSSADNSRAPSTAMDMETAKTRISEILAENSDDEDLAISAALSRATNLVEEVRGNSAMSK